MNTFIKDNRFNVLKVKVDNSIRSNKYNILFLILLTTYIIITILSINEAQILLPDIELKLPFLDLKVTIVTFLIFAPLILAIVYLNMLINISEHIKLTRFYKRSLTTSKESKFHLIPTVPFGIDSAYINPISTKQIYRIVVYFIIFIYPLVAQIIILGQD